jgi:hypothetical protein
VLLSLTSKGTLPWSVSKSDDECKKMKQQCDISKLCNERGLPEVAELILICRNAERTVRPNYDVLAQLLTKMHARKVNRSELNEIPSSNSLFLKSIFLSQASAQKASAKSTVASSTSTGSSRAKAAAKPVAAEEEEEEEEKDVPITKKRSVSKTKTAPIVVAVPESVELPALDTLAVTSPVGKRSRTARGTAATAAPAGATDMIDRSEDAPEAPPARGRGRPAKAAAAVKGPFSGATAGEQVEEPSSPLGHSLRARSARLSSSSVQSDADPSHGPFSAAFKTKTRGRSTSPAVAAVRSPPASGVKKAKAAKSTPVMEVHEADESASKTFMFQVVKGPCKGTNIVLTSHATVGKRKVADQVMLVGRGSECDYALNDEFLSEK